MKIFKRANHQGLLFVGNSEGQDWKFQARLKFSGEIENFKRDSKFPKFNPVLLILLSFFFQERKRHININLFGRWPLRWPGGRPTGRPGVKDLCAILGNPRNIKSFCPDTRPRRNGDRGDRTKFYVLKFYVPFLLPIFRTFPIFPGFPHFLKSENST